MSATGVFAVDRGVFDHPIFKPEPFTEREAWIWLVGAAAWKEKRVRVGGAIIKLERGQLAFATRFMAKRWRWSEARVRRFLNRLKIDAMVSIRTTHETTHITICNYDKYAFGRRTDDDEIDARPSIPATHERRKEEELNKERTEDEIGAPLIAPEAEELSTAFLNAVGFSDPMDIPPEFAGTLMRADAWCRAGWPVSMVVSETKRIMDGRPAPPGLKYFEKVFANKFASLNAPVPKGNATEKRNGTTENLSTVARRIAEQGISFGPKPSLSGSRLETNSPPVRMLPKG